MRPMEAWPPPKPSSRQTWCWAFDTRPPSPEVQVDDTLGPASRGRSRISAREEGRIPRNLTRQDRPTGRPAKGRRSTTGKYKPTHPQSAVLREGSTRIPPTRSTRLRPAKRNFEVEGDDASLAKIAVWVKCDGLFWVPSPDKATQSCHHPRIRPGFLATPYSSAKFARRFEKSARPSGDEGRGEAIDAGSSALRPRGLPPEIVGRLQNVDSAVSGSDRQQGTDNSRAFLSD